MLLQAQQKFQVLENLHICRTSSLALKNLSVYDLRVPSEYLALYRRVDGESLVSLLMKMLRFTSDIHFVKRSKHGESDEIRDRTMDLRG